MNIMLKAWVVLTVARRRDASVYTGKPAATALPPPPPLTLPLLVATVLCVRHTSGRQWRASVSRAVL